MLSVFKSVLAYIIMNKKCDILLKFDAKSIKTLLIFLDLNFKIIDFSHKDINHVYLFRKFDLKFLKKIENYKIKNISDYYKLLKHGTNRKRYSKSNKINNIKIKKKHIVLLSRWLNINIKLLPNLLNDFLKIINLQKEYKCLLFKKRNNYFIIVLNIKSLTSLVLFTKEFISRANLKFLLEYINNNNINNIFLENNYNILECLLALNNFLKTNYFKNNFENKIVHLERIE